VNESSGKSLTLVPGTLLTNESGPKYARVRTSLRRLIRREGMEAGTFLPSERDLAIKFGVSNITIKRALSDLAAEGIIQRKQGVGTFVADVTSQASGKAGAMSRPSLEGVLFLSCGQSPGSYADWLGGVERLMSAHDSAVIYSGVEKYDASESARLRRLIRRNGISAVLITGYVDNRVIRFAKALGPPVILIGNYPVTETVSQVCSDVHGATRKAVEMFLDAGCERIGLLNGYKRYGAAAQMAEAFQEAAHDHADRIKHSTISWLEDGSPHQHAVKFLETFGTKGGVLVEGGMGYDLMNALAEKGVSVPDDLKVIIYEPRVQTFQGDKQVARFAAPWLTDLPAAIYKLWRLLLEQPTSTIKFSLPLEFVKGDSM
jgi:DNA-binding LacI/PurR family transcriptional regulator